MKQTEIGAGSGTARRELGVPERFRPREYGVKETVPLEVTSLIRVSQQRGDINPALPKIKESIERGDMINLPDVALMRPEALVNYIDFVNRIWGSEHTIDAFEVDEDGYYHLVVAGHTRVEAVEQIETERIAEATEAGYDLSDLRPAMVWCKVHRDMQPADILSLQLDENLHEKPSQERMAIAMVETYLYGLEHGFWSTKKEFVQANQRKFSSNAFDAALVFCELDERIRAFVFTKEVPYGPIVELGKSVRPHRNYIARKFFGAADYDSLSDEVKIEVDDEVIKWNAAEVAEIQAKKLNVTACKKRYKSLRENWDSYDPEAEAQAALFSDPSREWRDRRRRTRDTLRDRVAHLATLPTKGAIQALQLHVEVMSPDTDEGRAMLELIDSGIRGYQSKFDRVIAGSGAIATAS